MDARAEELALYYAKKYPLTFRGETIRQDVFLSERYENAWEVAEKAARILKEDYGAKKVIAFGSITKRSSFTHWSDIDLAVWGVPDEIFYAAVGAVTGLTVEFKIDLIDVSGCKDSVRNAVETEGVEI